MLLLALCCSFSITTSAVSRSEPQESARKSAMDFKQEALDVAKAMMNGMVNTNSTHISRHVSGFMDSAVCLNAIRCKVSHQIREIEYCGVSENAKAAGLKSLNPLEDQLGEFNASCHDRMDKIFDNMEISFKDRDMRNYINDQLKRERKKGRLDFFLTTVKTMLEKNMDKLSRFNQIKGSSESVQKFVRPTDEEIVAVQDGINGLQKILTTATKQYDLAKFDIVKAIAKLESSLKKQ